MHAISGARRRQAQGPIPEDRRTDGRRGGGRAGVHEVPEGALAAARLDEHARAPEQGAETSLAGDRIFPNDASIVRLLGTLMAEQTDEWQVTADTWRSIRWDG